MKVKFSKNGYERYVMECKGFKKKDLVLKEGQIQANLPSAQNLEQAKREARNILTQNPSASGVTGDLGKFDGQQDAESGEGVKIQVPVNAPSSQLTPLQDMTRDERNDDVSIEFVDTKNNNGVGGMSESFKKRLVPFTKKELNEMFDKI